MLRVVGQQRPELALDEGLQAVVVAQQVQQPAQPHVGEPVVRAGLRRPRPRARRRRPARPRGRRGVRRAPPRPPSPRPSPTRRRRRARARSSHACRAPSRAVRARGRRPRAAAARAARPRSRRRRRRRARPRGCRAPRRTPSRRSRAAAPAPRAPGRSGRPRAARARPRARARRAGTPSACDRALVSASGTDPEISPVSRVRWLWRSSDSRSRSTRRESATVAAPRSSSIESRALGASSVSSTSRPQSWPRAPTVVSSQPLAASKPVRSGTRTARLRSSHPSSTDGEVAPGGVDGEHLVRQVLEHDRAPGHPGHLPHDLGGRRALDRELGERGVHLVGEPQLGQLRVDDARVHLLGDGREADLAGQLDQDEPAPLGDLHHPVGQPVEAAADLDHEAGDAGVGQVLDVRREPGRAPGAAARRWSGAARRRAAAGPRRRPRRRGSSAPAGRARSRRPAPRARRRPRRAAPAPRSRSGRCPRTGPRPARPAGRRRCRRRGRGCSRAPRLAQAETPRQAPGRMLGRVSVALPPCRRRTVTAPCRRVTARHLRETWVTGHDHDAIRRGHLPWPRNPLSLAGCRARIPGRGARRLGRGRSHVCAGGGDRWLAAGISTSTGRSAPAPPDPRTTWSTPPREPSSPRPTSPARRTSTRRSPLRVAPRPSGAGPPRASAPPP